MTSNPQQLFWISPNNTRNNLIPGKRNVVLPNCPLSFPPMNNQNQNPSLPFQVGNYVLTSEQTSALLSVSVRWNIPVNELLKEAGPEIGNPKTACLMVPIPGKGIVLGIERDGYTHS